MSSVAIFRTAVRSAVVAAAASSLCAVAVAEPVTYVLDPNHVHVMFAADHMGGLSKWRGLIAGQKGTVELDRSAHTGTVQVTLDMNSIDFGNAGLSAHAKTPEMFDVAKYPTATYTGKLVDWKNGAPTAAKGELTLHGVTKPVNLKIDSFLCKEAMGKNRCGVDAIGHIDRDQFGVSFGKQMGFKMNVTLRIQAEGVAK